MNIKHFVHGEGKEIKDMLSMISQSLNDKLKDGLGWSFRGHSEINEDYVNKSAYIEYKNKRYVNTTYAVLVKSPLKLKEVIEAGELMIDSFVEEVGNKYLVSLRQDITIQSDVDIKYIIIFRAALLPREVRHDAT